MTGVAKVYDIKNASGLAFSVFGNGIIKRIARGPVQLNLVDDSPLGVGCANLYIRRIRDGEIVHAPLLGPAGIAEICVDENGYQFKGCFEQMAFSGRLLLSEKCCGWLWHLEVHNTSGDSREFDIIHTQDVGLSSCDGNEKNEAYISQYIDYKPLPHESFGTIVCCRQNEHGPGCMPWLALGTLGRTGSFSTDGVQFYGPNYRADGVARALSQARLGGLCQQEFGMVSLQSEPATLEPGQKKGLGFFGIFHEHHPEATGEDLTPLEPELQHISELARKPWESQCVFSRPTGSLFSTSPLFISEDLTEAELDRLFSPRRRHEEACDGKLLSFFYGSNRYVALRWKELVVQRPHGHIMKTSRSLNASDATMSCTAFMFGVFQSHITQGNVNFNRLTTVNSNMLNSVRHTGQRIFAVLDGQYHQLAVPSAFDMSPDQCRWIYKKGGLLFEVVSAASANAPELTLEIRVLNGAAPEWLISNNLTHDHHWQVDCGSSGSCKITPGPQSGLATMFPGGCFHLRMETYDAVEAIGGDEMLFNDGKSRGLDFIATKLAMTESFQMRIQGMLSEDASHAEPVPQDAFKGFELNKPDQNEPLSAISEILPWFVHNAFVHYLTPHGLEQYGGAAWGTRDICQGPLEMLLAQGQYGAARKTLATIFENQHRDGNWPQWWMFDGYREIRADESHGDVIFWPLLAACDYIRASGDHAFLDECLPYYDGPAETETVMDHIGRAIKNITDTRFVNGAKLVNYSDGDWNDSMQPAREQLKDRMISAWTVCLSYQTFRALEAVCRHCGREEAADRTGRLCDDMQKDFSRLLVKDGVVAGFGLVGEKGAMDLLLHPGDDTTGIHYRLLPMMRGIISGIFSPAQAEAHAGIIEKHLKGPDGARLMDRPVKYNGGLKARFKRAESASFFGREIGIMYTHAHLRYCEAMAKLGRPREFVEALRQVVPVDMQKAVPRADIRQSNCYYSSSDGGFASRYEVNRRYEDLLAGKVALKGGWRVYSSGPGMFVRFVIEYLLGIRHDFGRTIFDPVMTAPFDGLTAGIRLHGCDVKLRYCVSGENDGVKRVEVNGKAVDFEVAPNPYRRGGAAIRDEELKAVLKQEDSIIAIHL